MKRTLKRWWVGTVLKAPMLLWVLVGVGLAYLLFFIRPTFFSAQEMPFFKYLPATNPIGIDLTQVLNYSRTWWVDKSSPFIGNNLYPPLASLLFIPLIFLNPGNAYFLITCLSLLGYLIITLVLPLKSGQTRQITPVLLLVFVTGLLSYGLQFELERGQFNLIAMTLCLLSVWLFHAHPKLRALAYVLFSLAVQLKVYPAIFIVMLISDWHAWKDNIRRLLVLGVVNVAALFVMGIGVFRDFLKAITSQSLNPASWTGNHSINSFVELIAQIASSAGWNGLKQNQRAIQIVLLGLVLLLIGLIMLRLFKQNRPGLNPYLLLACSLGALMIPPVSHDYTLSFLAAPVALLLTDRDIWKPPVEPGQQLSKIMLLTIFSAAYASTLFSYTNKPLLANNNFPALFLMLVLVTLLVWMKEPTSINFTTGPDTKPPD
jgi:hypothetical protein